MYRITILCAGKFKETHWKEAADEFLKRLKPYAKIDIIEVEASALGGSMTEEKAMELEGERLARRLPTDAFVIALERKGQRLTSPELAANIKEHGERGRHLAFIIGGTAGLSPTLLSRVNIKISLSEMTFTHEMARVFLLEQIYRAMTILTGKEYHR